MLELDLELKIVFYQVLYGIANLTLLAVLILPLILWFFNRRKSDFSRQIKIIALVDVTLIALWFLCITFKMLTNSYWKIFDIVEWIALPGGVLGFLLVPLRIFSVWKMKAGRKFRALFKRPNVSRFLFIIYLFMTFAVAIAPLILLVNILIVGTIIIVLLWLLFGKLDILSMAFGGKSGSSSGGGGFGGGSGGSSVHHQCCDTCNRFMNGKCAENPSMDILDKWAHCCGSYSRRSS